MNICIAYPVFGKKRETFVSNHITYLPGRIYELSGWPAFPIINKKPPTQARRLLMRFLHRITHGRSTVHLISNYLSRHHIDVLLVEYGDYACRFLESSLQARIPLFAHFHGIDAYDKKNIHRLRSQYDHLFMRASGIGAVSKAMAKQLKSLGCPDEKIHRVSCGVDVERFSITDPSQNGKLLVFIGRFVEKKAPFHLLEAFSIAQKKCLNASLIMGGDGPLLDQAKQKAVELGIAEKVQFPGQLTHTQVAGTLRRARAYVQHSVTTLNGDSEGTPVIILEAAASGLPVIATLHAGIPEVIEDTVSGLLVPEHDIEGMAQNMIKLLSDPKYAQVLGAQGANIIRARYGIEQTVGNLYQALMNIHTQKNN